MLSVEARDELIKRLRRIEGQTRGIQRMLQEDRECRDILTQLASVRAATQSLAAELLRHQLRDCMAARQNLCLDSEQSLDDLIDMLLHT